MESSQNCKYLKVAGFWICTLWCPIVGISLLVLVGNQVAVAGVVIPICIVIALCVVTIVSVPLSGMADRQDLKEAFRQSRTSVRSSSKQDVTAGTGYDPYQARPSGSRQFSDSRSGSFDGHVAAETFGVSAMNEYAVGLDHDSPAIRMPNSGITGRPITQQRQGVNANMTWQVCLDTHWVDFEEMQQQQFNMSRENGIPECEFFARGQKYVLDLDNNVQRNTVTGVVRQVRYVTKAPPVPPVRPTPQDRDPSMDSSVPLMPRGDQSIPDTPHVQLWQWQAHPTPDGWKDLDRGVCEIITRARSDGQPTAEYTIGNQNYQAIFARNVQRNIKTTTERPIRPKARQEL
jgi:hypothetical protein